MSEGSIDVDLESVLAQHDKLLAKGKYDDGMQLLLACLTKVEQACGTESLEVARLLDALGQGLKETENFSGAKQYLSRSLNIKKGQLGSDDPDLAMAMRRLAFCLEPSDSTERIKLLSDATDIEIRAGIEDPFGLFLLEDMSQKVAAVVEEHSLELINDRLRREITE